MHINTVASQLTSGWKTNAHQKYNSSLENVEKKHSWRQRCYSHTLLCSAIIFSVISVAQTRKRGKWQFSSFMIRSDDYCVQRHAGGSFSFVVMFFLTLDVWSYCSWHQLEVSKKEKVNHFISQLIHDYCKVLSSVQWYLKQKAWPDLLTVRVYHCKIANILYFQLLFLSYVLFFLLLMTCMEYASVTAPALVAGKSKQSLPGLMIQHVINPVTETDKC